MIRGWLRWICGDLSIRVRGAELERFLNLCAQSGIELRQIRRTQLDEMTARLSTAEFRKLSLLHRRTRCRVHILKRRGVPFLWNRYRFRFGLWAGLLLIILVCVQLHTRIWVIRTNFAEGVDGERVMQELSELGVHTGMKTAEVDPQKAKVQLLNACDDLSFFALNVDGCVLSVETGLAEPPPELEEETTARKVVAVRDGIIQKQIVRRGTELFLTGDAVVKGQVLVDSLVRAQTDWGTDRLVTASADIWAQTNYEIETVMVESAQKKGEITAEKTYYALCLGKTRINFYRRRCLSEENCDRISLVRCIRLNDYLTLPIALYSETCQYYTLKTTKLEKTHLQAQIVSGTRRRVLGQLTQGSVVSSDYQWDTQDGLLMAKAAVQCYEQIGEAVEDGRTQKDLPQDGETQENEESET